MQRLRFAEGQTAQQRQRPDVPGAKLQGEKVSPATWAQTAGPESL